MHAQGLPLYLSITVHLPCKPVNSQEFVQRISYFYELITCISSPCTGARELLQTLRPIRNRCTPCRDRARLLRCGYEGSFLFCC